MAAAAAIAAAQFLPGSLFTRNKRRIPNASVSEEPGNALNTSEKDELEAKLAAAEAEAMALKNELTRRNKDYDFSKLKEKRIDGTGYRETLLGVAGEGELPTDWGLSEGSLQEPEVEVEPVEELSEEEQAKIVQRRLLIGGVLAAATLGLAFLKFPPGFIKPSKPLPYYLFRILQLEQRLEDIETSNAGADVVLTQLKSLASSAQEWKDILVSAAAWLEGQNAEKASSIAFSIYGYLVQADSNTYFDAIGSPSDTQKFEFLRFSLDSIKAALALVREFISLVPREFVDDAKLNRNAITNM